MEAESQFADAHSVRLISTETPQKASEAVLKPYVEAISLPPGAALALLPILGYATVFAYELGKCEFYRIPPELIRLDLTTGLIVAVGVGGILLAFPIFITFLSLESLGFEYFVRIRHSMVFAAILLGVAGIYLNPALFVLALGITVGYVGFSVTAIHKESAVKKAEARKSYANIISNLSIFTDYIGWRRFIYAFVILVVLLCTYNLGYMTAAKQMNFLTDGNYVVVAIYGDSIVLLDKVKKRFGKGIYYTLGRRIKILNLQDHSGLLLERQSFGLMPRDDMGNFWLK